MTPTARLEKHGVAGFSSSFEKTEHDRHTQNCTTRVQRSRRQDTPPFPPFRRCLVLCVVLHIYYLWQVLLFFSRLATDQGLSKAPDLSSGQSVRTEPQYPQANRLVPPHNRADRGREADFGACSSSSSSARPRVSPCSAPAHDTQKLVCACW